jgi:hypothetical protein
MIVNHLNSNYSPHAHTFSLSLCDETRNKKIKLKLIFGKHSSVSMIKYLDKCRTFILYRSVRITKKLYVSPGNLG